VHELEQQRRNYLTF